MGNISREIIWKSPSPSLPSQLKMLSMLKKMVAGGISNDSADLPPVARRKELVTWGVKRGGGDNANIRLIWPLTHLTIYPSEDSRGTLGSRTQTRGLEVYLQDKTPTKAACILPCWKFLVPGEKTKWYWYHSHSSENCLEPSDREIVVVWMLESCNFQIWEIFFVRF